MKRLKKILPSAYSFMWTVLGILFTLDVFLFYKWASTDYYTLFQPLNISHYYPVLCLISVLLTLWVVVKSEDIMECYNHWKYRHV